MQRQMGRRVVIYGLCNDAVSISDCTVSKGGMVKDLDRISKWPSRNLKLSYYPAVFLEDRKISKGLSQGCRPPDTDLNPGFPECEPGMLTTLPRSSVNSCVTHLKKDSNS